MGKTGLIAWAMRTRSIFKQIEGPCSPSLVCRLRNGLGRRIVGARASWIGKLRRQKHLERAARLVPGPAHVVWGRALALLPLPSDLSPLTIHFYLFNFLNS